jgi:hypothetical protein
VFALLGAIALPERPLRNVAALNAAASDFDPTTVIA